MIEESEGEEEYDIYYRGTQEELYAFLYPLTGPAHPIFEHLKLTRLHHSPREQSFEVKYQPRDFDNIDKQKEKVVYSSTLQSTQSNYFYSLYQPECRCFVWQNVGHFVEMRPQNNAGDQKQSAKMEEDSDRCELEVVEWENGKNRAREVVGNTLERPLRQNHVMPKDEYLSHLTQ